MLAPSQVATLKHLVHVCVGNRQPANLNAAIKICRPGCRTELGLKGNSAAAASVVGCAKE